MLISLTKLDFVSYINRDHRNDLSEDNSEADVKFFFP